MRELSKNDWRVLAQLLEMAAADSYKSGENTDMELQATPDNSILTSQVLAFEGIADDDFTWNFGNKILLDREWIMDFFASIARENASDEA